MSFKIPSIQRGPKGITLTKDNLARKTWKDIKQCCFCNKNETIHHLLSYSHYAKFHGRVAQISFDLQTPDGISRMVIV
jgi:hypothetical protein